MDVYHRLTDSIHPVADVTVVLTHEQRSRGRLRTQDTNGNEVRLFLERGKTLLPGDLLKTECGKVIEIQAASESVMRAHCDDWFTFSRACYHLGNRHVKIEIGERWLKITPDHVLQEMLQLLGLQVESCEDVFIPESGAYFKGLPHSHDHGDHHHQHATDHGHHH